MSERSRPSYGVWRRICQFSTLLLLLVAVPAGAAGRLVLALGDSLTAGYQLPADAAFPAQLQAALARNGVSARVHNAGVSGDTTAQARARLGWVLQSLGRNPDLAIVALGANDMLRGQPVAAAYANLDAILAEFDRRGVPVILAGMRAAPNLGADYRRAFDAIFPALAKKHRATLYPFFLEGVAAQPSLQLADGMHPNREGVARMVAGVEPLVRRALARKQP